MQHVHTNCLICGKSVPIPGLDKHIRAAHTSLEKIVCDICGKVLCNKWAHQQHYEAEHVYTDQRVQCDICKKWSVQNIISFIYVVQIELIKLIVGSSTKNS